MILSMQTAFAACKLPFAAQQKKVATISKKRVVKSKKRTYRKASARKYAHRELNSIMRILERKFLFVRSDVCRQLPSDFTLR